MPLSAIGQTTRSSTSRITVVPGFLTQGTKALVAVRIEGLHSKWLGEGMSFEGNTILAIDVPNALVKIRDPLGAEYSLPLNISKIIEAPSIHKKDGSKAASLLPHVPESEIQKARRTETVIHDIYPPRGFKPRTDDLDFDWIKSAQNPMRDRPMNPVDREFIKWPSLSQAEKDAFIELYRQCGYGINVSTDNKGVGMLSRRLQPPSENAGSKANKKPSPIIPKT
ncbi:MAG: hypothetical protein NT173_01910 [Opitutales bacterium]|nr:hypothetical protein [Opitutales bacterium]